MSVNLVDKAIELLQTPDNFIEWLHTFPQDNVVGAIASSKYCPIATFLVDKGVKYNVVTDSQIILYAAEEVYIIRYEDLPQLGWLTKVIQNIDDLPFDISPQALDLVTAKQVLDIMLTSTSNKHDNKIS